VIAPKKPAHRLSWSERILYIIFAPALFVGGWYVDFGRYQEVFLAPDLLFFVIALLYVLYGLNQHLFEWGLRISGVFYVLFVIWVLVLLSK